MPVPAVVRTFKPMDDNGGTDEDRVLSLRLDVQLDRQPIRGQLRSTLGAEERFVGWLGFVEALERLAAADRESQPNRPNPKEQR